MRLGNNGNSTQQTTMIHKSRDGGIDASHAQHGKACSVIIEHGNRQRGSPHVGHTAVVMWKTGHSFMKSIMGTVNKIGKSMFVEDGSIYLTYIINHVKRRSAVTGFSSSSTIISCPVALLRFANEIKTTG